MDMDGHQSGTQMSALAIEFNAMVGTEVKGPCPASQNDAVRGSDLSDAIEYGNFMLEAHVLVEQRARPDLVEALESPLGLSARSSQPF